MPQSKQAKKFYMKPWFWALAVVVVLGLWLWGTYNSLVTVNIRVDAQWAQVETQYQRRFDLIPRLINVTSSAAQFEANTFKEITDLRSRWQSTTNPNERVQIAQQSDSALSRLIAVFENYPVLRSIDAYRALQDELSGTENRVAVARMDYNNVVREYNTAIKVFPGSIVAGWFGFSERDYFQATSGSENPPGVPGNIGV